MDDPWSQPAAYWSTRVEGRAQPRDNEDAFVDTKGRAVWTWRIRPDNTGPYMCIVIGVLDAPPWALIDLGDVVVPVTRAMIKARWEALGK